MQGITTIDIMLGAWIREVINLDVVLDAFPYKAQTVLPYDNRVDCSLTYEKLAFQVLGFIDDHINIYYRSRNNN